MLQQHQKYQQGCHQQKMSTTEFNLHFFVWRISYKASIHTGMSIREKEFGHCVFIFTEYSSLNLRQLSKITIVLYSISPRNLAYISLPYLSLIVLIKILLYMWEIKENKMSLSSLILLFVSKVHKLYAFS